MEAAIPPDLLSGLRIAGMHLASVGRKFFSSKSWRRGPRRFGLCAHGFDHLGIRQLDYGAASPAGVPNRGPEEIAPCAVDKYKPIMKITGLANIECDVRVLRHELLRRRRNHLIVRAYQVIRRDGLPCRSAFLTWKTRHV